MVVPRRGEDHITALLFDASATDSCEPALAVEPGADLCTACRWYMVIRTVDDNVNVVDVFCISQHKKF